MTKQFFAFTFFTAVGFTAFAQNELDIYRYSNTYNEGSARFESMGGSFGALGADMSSARINPAGFGRYSSSQFAFGLSGISIKSSADFKGTTTNSDAFKVRLANMGLVFAGDLSGNRRGFLFHQFGITYTSMANFGNTVSYTGQQYESLLESFAATGQGVAPADLVNVAPFTTSLAYETYAIDDDGNGNYIPRLTAGDMIHKRTIDTRGGMSELAFTYSANYLNKLYFGANLGVQFIRYTENMTHSESLIDTVGVSLRSFDYEYNLKTRGTGYNLKIGAIYLASEAVRLGLAIHTPTFFNMTDNWNADMTAYHSDGVRTVPADLVPTGIAEYKLRTPARMIGSFAYVFGTKGCINIDLEYVNYGWGRLGAPRDATYGNYNYKAENTVAKDRFTSVLNTRIGGEVVIFSNFFLRAGYGFLPIGDKNITAASGRNFDQLISGGIGVRANKWNFDVAVRSLTQKRPYVAFTGSSADISTQQLYFVLNAQLKF